MSKADAVRQQVSEAYTRAVKTSTTAVGGCCGPLPVSAEASAGGCCGPAVEPKGITAQVAGYDQAELAALPTDAVQNSFGCGNPLAFSEVEAGQTVLDLGSGAGIDLLIAANKVGPSGRVIGVDMTDEMIARARDNIAKAGLDQVEVRKGVIEELPVEDASVDFVISNCVINLSPQKERVFGEIARVLRPGGRFSISDIVLAEDSPAWVRQDKALYSACVAGAISEPRYLQGLRDAGLSEVQVTERLVYEDAQIRGFLRSEELPGSDGPLTEQHLDQMTQALSGKVWSIKVIGTRTAPA